MNAEMANQDGNEQCPISSAIQGDDGSQGRLSKDTKIHLQHINAALMALNATGEDGFEGMVGVALRELTGIPFRLAKSGFQRGIDGKFDQAPVCFEAKRYSDKISRNELLPKIADLARANKEPDMVWVLGATVPVSTQDADDLRTDGRRSGISVLICDWSKIQLPKLAVLMASGGIRIEEFLQHHLLDPDLLDPALVGLRALRSAFDFETEARSIKSELEAPSMTAVIAKAANTEWLTKTFSSRKEARIHLGQPLSPGGDAAAKTLPRTSLVARIQPLLASQTDGGIAFVLGDEGCGKSWIVAQSWLGLEQKPLMVVMGAEIFQPGSPGELKSLLIRKLIEQTGDLDSEDNRRDWDLRFVRWAAYPAADQPRLIVMIDGINQRTEVEWSRTIDGMGELLEKVGGRLIVTSRTHYFSTAVKLRLLSPLIEIPAAEWSIEERDEILRDRGIDPASLHGTVGQTLRNPRILGIAVELFSRDKVSSFREFSISRLLFEHIRDGSRASSASQFAKKLQTHAQKILIRLGEQKTDDLKLFESEVPAVADGRFFMEVEGEPDRYELKDHGLTLALGFSVLDNLRQAQRNQRDPDESLATLLEPIAALDSTCEVLLAALTIACVDENQQNPLLISTLVKGFASLQNPDRARLPEFAGLARSNPSGFLDALRWLAMQGGRQPNFEWVSGAIRANRAAASVWTSFAKEVSKWLSVSSLVVKDRDIRRMNPPTDDAAEIERRRIAQQSAIDLTIHDLSPCERAILARLESVKEGSVCTLAALAIEMLVGMPLASFAESLMDWSFSRSINSEIESPYEEFTDLVSFNTVDWTETRNALKAVARDLNDPGVSKTGKWALVSILRATGDISDAAEAQILANELTKDLPPFPPGWRLIETYCATDPCDPDSIEPENIANTAIKYEAIDISQIRVGRWMAGEDHFFQGATPGIARFRLDTAIIKHRALAEQIVERSGESLELALFDLVEDAPILTAIQIDSLIAKWRSLNNGLSIDQGSDESWSYCQILVATFPHLGRSEKVNLLLGITDTQRIPADLIELIAPINPEEFDSILHKVRESRDEKRLYLLLLSAKNMSECLSRYATDWVELMLASEVEQLRVSALGVISRSQNPSMLRAVVESGWNASFCANTNNFEVWYGSISLLNARQIGLIDEQEMIMRICPSFYRVVVTALSIEGIRAIGTRFDAAIRKLVSPETNLVTPPIEIDVRYSRSNTPPRFTIDEPEPIFHDLSKQLEYMSKAEDFDARRHRCSTAFEAFKSQLTIEGTRILLDNWSLDAFAMLVANVADLAQEWFSLFMTAPDDAIPALHNLMVLLATALADSHPEHARLLRKKASRCEPFVRTFYGETELNLEILAIWYGADTAVQNRERFRRLDQAGSDHQISLEVLGALVHGKQELLNEYVADRISRPEPAYVARALMVAGFSDENPYSVEVLSRYEGASGFIGKAHRAALYAYQRNSWARTWFAQMCSTVDPKIFWQSGILLRKIVDSRFAVWNEKFERKGSVIQRFGNEVERGINNRYQQWERHRKDTLFGRKVPSRALIASQYIDEIEQMGAVS